MFVSFSGFFVWLTYLRKACIPFWLLGILSCKDFKSWESLYADEVNIQFKREMDERAPMVLKDLQSDKLSELYFRKIPAFTDKDSCFQLKSNHILSIPLDPKVDTVSFELGNTIYHQSVTIDYKRITSLISPEAGGLHIQYVINRIQLTTTDNKRPIFKRYTIKHPTPLKEDKKNKTAHVTLYY